jgi:hypothetical protein
MLQIFQETMFRAEAIPDTFLPELPPSVLIGVLGCKFENPTTPPDEKGVYKRIDFITLLIVVWDDENDDTAEVIHELKQWENDEIDPGTNQVVCSVRLGRVFDDENAAPLGIVGSGLLEHCVNGLGLRVA